jgi:hypothetical protein
MQFDRWRVGPHAARRRDFAAAYGRRHRRAFARHGPPGGRVKATNQKLAIGTGELVHRGMNRHLAFRKRHRALVRKNGGRFSQRFSSRPTRSTVFCGRFCRWGCAATARCVPQYPPAPCRPACARGIQASRAAVSNSPSAGAVTMTCMAWPRRSSSTPKATHSPTIFVA